jgi:methylmalonyl-CoA mutase N-terminal domain/subunit
MTAPARSTGSPPGTHGELQERIASWRRETLPRGLERLGLSSDEVDPPLATPLDTAEHDFLRDVGLPGEYPFTSWLYPSSAHVKGQAVHVHRAGRYSGYGTSTDCRDYYASMREQGLNVGGANIASDLPSQLGWDSDDPRADGEVGRVGVAIDSLRDFEIVYEAFQGEHGIDRISSNWTINAPATVYVAFYYALAVKLGLPTEKLRCTPQNDILKEYIARGLYIFPVEPSLRLVRDTFTFMNKNMPRANTISICAEHIRYAGATTPQSLAFAFANGKEYVRRGVAAGLDVDDFVRRFTYRGFGDSSLGFIDGVAAPRAARRMWARIIREEFGAKTDRACLLRGGEHAWGNSYTKMTAARYINNIVRATIEAMIQACASGELTGGLVPFDEPLGLGHSLEAQQVTRDIKRIIAHEAKLGETLDPFAGSYAIEKRTDEIEAATLAELEHVERSGGALWGVESGYYRGAIAGSAWDSQRKLENGEEIWVGVNGYTGADEIEVHVERTPEYDQEAIENAQERQVASLRTLRRERDHSQVRSALDSLRAATLDDSRNVIPPMVDCALAYATIGEICDVLRDAFGEASYV